MVLLKYRSLVVKLFELYSVKNVKPGQKKFVCPTELMDLAKHSELFVKGTQFMENDVNVCFNLAMMTQVDELTSDRIFKMSPLEFYEALARIADRVSLPSINMHQVSIASEDRHLQPLHYKLESLLHHMHACVLNYEDKKEIPLKPDSIFDDAVYL